MFRETPKKGVRNPFPLVIMYSETISNMRVLKFFGQFHEFMRSSFLPKCQPKILRIFAVEVYYFKVNTKRESMFFLQEDRLSFVLTLK